MRVIPAAVQTHLETEVMTLARLIHITRADGVHKYFTDAVDSIDYGGNTYLAAHAFSASAIMTSSNNQSLQSVSLEVMLNASGISEADIRSRRYLQAACEIMLINYKSPDDGVVLLYSGYFKKIEITNNGRAIVEVSSDGGAGGIGGKLGIEKYSRTCRADFGDERCGIDIEALAVPFTVDATYTATLTFNSDDLHQPLDTYTGGKLLWVTGDNAGTYSQVKISLADGDIQLVSISNPLQVGDTGKIYPSCDKLIDSGCTLYDNVVNFRGEPHVPTSLVYNLQPATVKV